MIDDIIGFFRDVMLSGAIVCSIFAVIIAGMMWVNIKFFDNVPTTVKVDGKVVYQGISAGVSVESAGANTTVTVRGGPLYLFPKAYYTSANVELVGDKR